MIGFLSPIPYSEESDDIFTFTNELEAMVNLIDGNIDEISYPTSHSSCIIKSSGVINITYVPYIDFLSKKITEYDDELIGIRLWSLKHISYHNTRDELLHKKLISYVTSFNSHDFKLPSLYDNH